MSNIFKTVILLALLVSFSADLHAENEIWTYCDAGGPLPRTRSGHTAIHDLAGDRMIIFGGMSDEYGYELGDMWALDDSCFTWTELEAFNGGPPGLRDHAAIYDPLENNDFWWHHPETFAPKSLSSSLIRKEAHHETYGRYAP